MTFRRSCSFCTLSPRSDGVSYVPACLISFPMAPVLKASEEQGRRERQENVEKTLCFVSKRLLRGPCFTSRSARTAHFFFLSFPSFPLVLPLQLYLRVASFRLVSVAQWRLRWKETDIVASWATLSGTTCGLCTERKRKRKQGNGSRKSERFATVPS